jgi:hypothetical protein
MLSPADLERMGQLWDEIAQRPILPYANAESDVVRKSIDECIAENIFHLDENGIDQVHVLRERLTREPMVYVTF